MCMTFSGIESAWFYCTEEYLEFGWHWGYLVSVSICIPGLRCLDGSKSRAFHGERGAKGRIA